jgi:hemolysin III
MDKIITHNRRREFTKGEELANAISHLTGTVLAAAGLILMLVYSAIQGNAWHIVSTALFGSSMVILYLSSTFTHWLKPGKAKDFFFILDQIAIFLLIAGTYTPVALIALKGVYGWTMFGIEWGMALAGIIYRLKRPNRYESGVGLLSVVLYALMGWLFLFFILVVLRLMQAEGIMWIFIGGAFYSLGILFFLIRRLKYHHLIWHLFVIAGSISHFIAVFFYVIPITS